jgi:hypothetical protein
MPNSLAETLTSAQAALSDRKTEATVTSLPVAIRGHQVRLALLLSTLSRHVHALEDVLVDEVRAHLGADPARELARVCHLLQLDTLSLQGRLYGSSQTMRLPWRILWDEMQLHLKSLLELEADLATSLAEVVPEAALDVIADRLCESESRAPTRPHPHIPQRGARGRLARRVARRADVLWDGLQGRDNPVATLVRPTVEPEAAS